MARQFKSGQLRDNLSLSGSFSGSFQGDGSNLTGITAEWDGSHFGDAFITGSLTISGSGVNLNVLGDISASAVSASTYYGDGSQLTGIDSSSYASTASYVETAQTASYVLNAISSSYATFAVSASYAVSASHEIIKEVSSSYADTASFAQSGDGIFSGSFSGSFEGDGSQLTGIDSGSWDGQYSGSAGITGSLTIEGSGSTIFDVQGSAGQLFSVSDGLLGTLMEVNDISGMPLFQVSASGLIEIPVGPLSCSGDIEVRNITASGDISASGTMSAITGSFSYIQGNSPIKIDGKDSSISLHHVDGVDNSTFIVDDNSVKLSINDNATYIDLSDSGVSVKGEFHTNPLTASVDISSSGDVYGVTGSFQHLLGDGSQLTNLPTSSTFPYTGDAEITGSLVISGSFIPRGPGVSHISNVSIGQNAGPGLMSTGQGNVLIGDNAGELLDDEDYAVLIGSSAGRSLQYSSGPHSNVFIGGAAGRNLRGTLGVAADAIDGNVLIGLAAGYGAVIGNTDGVKYNTGIGQNSLYYINGGQGNTTIGFEAGKSISSGDGNIILGSGSLGTDNPSNQLRIGNGNSLVTISASLATGDIIFPSTASAAYFVGDGSQLTGIVSSSYALTASYAVSASHEIIKEISSSYADTASFAQSGNGVFSGSFSGSFQGDGSQLTNLPTTSGKFGIANSSGEYTYYSDLSSSLQAATAGDTIQLFTNVTEASDHVYHLKDKVDFNFNGNELFISASATLDAKDMFSDNDIAVSCSFYNGRIRFTQGEGVNIFNRLLYIDNPASEITNIGFEWEVENGSNYTPYYPIRNDGTLNGGKFLGSPFSYLIETFGVLKNLDVYAKKGIYFKGYLKKHYNLKVHTYGGQAGAEASNSYIYDSYFHAETGQGLSAFYVINCTIIADDGAGITGTRRLVNSTIRNSGGIGVSLIGEMIGGSVYTEQDVSVAAGSSEVLGVTIYNFEYLGPGITLGNGEISNCAIIDDYPTNGQNSIKIDTGATTATITNCSFDFYNNTTLNTAITADDDDTPVFFANNTFKNCTPTNPTKVTQAVLNTPDAQGNIVINN
jgi:hypothetical protein